ncbi:MAG: cytochrome C [Leptolyngbya foveolarum]|uniref:Cytochrome C n=1 Tax=Leptolyngbya foveolarum TaxID=47253 RepID=A0A2W4ULH1_9CYAN|nr:MAG: cytochrome C [Leptolyngbya foveolarum]
MAPEQVVQVSVTNPLLRASVIVIAMLTALVLTFWSLHSMQTSDPYVQKVLQLSGDSARGKDIFALNCATCHGLEAAGEVGPSLNGVSERKSKVALIEQVISGQTPPMPQFQPNEKDMADLLSFLETL